MKRNIRVRGNNIFILLFLTLFIYSTSIFPIIINRVPNNTQNIILETKIQNNNPKISNLDNYTIQASFENDYEEVNANLVSYNGTQFTTDALAGNYSVLIDNNKSFVRWQNNSNTFSEGSMELYFSPFELGPSSGAHIMGCTGDNNYS